MAEGKNLVGVDIGSSAIKVCQLKASRKGFSVHRFGYAPLGPAAIVDGQVLDAGRVIEAIQKAFHDGKVRERDVAVSVSGQAVIIRKITVPMMTPGELEEQIQWEAEQHIPFDIKDVQVDYQVLRRRPDTSQMDLLLVAAKKDQIGAFTDLARTAKLKPIVCDIDAFTVQNLFEVSRGFPTDQSIALINVGASTSSLNIIANGVSAFTREIASGGRVITEEIQKQLACSFEEAEAFKCGVGAPPEVVRIVDSMTDTIAGEIQRSLDFFLATTGEGETSNIYVTGGTSNLSSLAAAIGRRARAPVEVWRPTERVAIEGKDVDANLLTTRSAQLAVALGLALRKSREVRA